MASCLVRFVKGNFLVDRVFYHVTDLNWHALEWCNRQNGTYHWAVDGVPQKIDPRNGMWRTAAYSAGDRVGAAQIASGQRIPWQGRYYTRRQMEKVTRQ